MAQQRQPKYSRNAGYPQYPGYPQYGGSPYYPPYPPYQAGPGAPYPPYPGMPYAYGAPGAAQPGYTQPGTAQPGTAQPGAAQPGTAAGPQIPGAAPAGTYGMPHYAAGMPPKTAQPPRRRKNHAPLVVALLCVGIVVLVSLTGAAVNVMQRDGALRERPEPGEVPSFTIEAPPEQMDDGLSTVEIARMVGPSVVCINVYEPGSISIAGSGSGIILNEEGFIVTNAHVVENTSAITVKLEDGREMSAWVVGSDTRTDLAVVKITADDLVPAVFGDSDALQVGERAVAIGNAAGEFSGTVTQGIISGLNREVTMESSNGYVTMTLIQTSAAINPGNSGGALVNRFGQVIGINSAKLNSAMFEGIGFAIPSAAAQPIVADLIDYGYVKDRVALGVMVIALSPATGPANDLPEQGLYISSIEEYSDLNRHDVTVGDVILKADGVTLVDTADLLDVLETHKPGETVELEIQKHGSGTIITIDVELVESRNN
ncbi:MAG: trypsin-like serine protease [Subdoligranulum sp.]|nr:trypsin-like serine protease [Subdoligranulum sp.]